MEITKDDFLVQRKDNIVTAKLLTNGGNSFCEAIKNIEHNLKVVPSVDKCMYVISSMLSIKSMNEAEDTE